MVGKEALQPSCYPKTAAQLQRHVMVQSCNKNQHFDSFRASVNQFILLHSLSTYVPLIHCINGLVLWREFSMDDTICVKKK
jgi:hypothetical protein